MSGETESCEIKEIEAQDVDSYLEISRVLNVLGNKTRIAILAAMEKYGEVCACELLPSLGLPQPTITTHLRKMYDIGLLEHNEVWKYSYYSISPKYEALVRDILKNQVLADSELKSHEQTNEDSGR